MKSKASYFSFSAPILKENLRRFWPISVISFIIYFLSGPFAVLTSYGHLNSVRIYLNNSLNNLNVFFLAVHFLAPIAASLAVYKYLHSPGSVAVMNSLPASRCKLFNSNYISGLLLSELPMLAIGFVYLLLATPVYNSAGIDVFARIEILNWVMTSFLIIATIYTISVFAGAITGNTLYHFLGSLLFNGLVPVLYLFLIAYAQFYLWGFDSSGLHMTLCAKFHPFTGVIMTEGDFTLLQVAFYLFVIAAVLVLSAVLYNRRKMEKVGDALTWRSLEPFINWIFAFLGMTLMGAYFYTIDNELPMLYVGGVIGFLILFFIGRMLVKKSFRIFNKRTMRSLLACLLICALLVCGFAFDLTGYENRVPKEASVESMSVNRLSLPIPWDNNYLFYGQGVSNIRFTDPEVIKALTGLHQELVDHKQLLEQETDEWYRYFNLSFSYERSFLDMDRTYSIPYDLLSRSENFKAFFNLKK